MNNLSKVAEYLENLGLTAQESKVYCGLIETGPTTVKLLAERVGNQRANTHFIVESLIKKGLVYQTKEGARRRIVAEGSEKIRTLTEQEVMKYQSLQGELDVISSIINNVVGSAAGQKAINFKYYEGKKAVYDNVYAETLKMTGTVCSFINLDKFYAIYKEGYSSFDEAIKDTNKEVFNIAVDSPLSRKILKDYSNTGRYKIKYIDSEKLGLGFDISMYNDKVAIIQLEPNSISAIVIDSRMIFTVLMALYGVLWQDLK